MSEQCSPKVHVYPDGYYSRKQIQGLEPVAVLEVCSDGTLRSLVYYKSDSDKKEEKVEVSDVAECCRSLRSLSKRSADNMVELGSPGEFGELLRKLLSSYELETVLLCLTLCASRHRVKPGLTVGEALAEVLGHA